MSSEPLETNPAIRARNCSASLRWVNVGMSNDSSTNRGVGVLCILLCMYGASMFAAVARIAESGSVELISESVSKGSLLLL